MSSCSAAHRNRSFEIEKKEIIEEQKKKNKILITIKTYSRRADIVQNDNRVLFECDAYLREE